MSDFVLTAKSIQLFIRFTKARRYDGDMHLEILKNWNEIENHEKYSQNKAEEKRADMQATINAQASSLHLAETKAEEYEAKIKEHQQRLTVLRSDYSNVPTRVAGSSKRR